MPRSSSSISHLMHTRNMSSSPWRFVNITVWKHVAEFVLSLTQVVAECTLMAKLHNFERPGSLPTITASFLESMVLSMMCPRLQVVFLSMWLLCGEQQLSCSSIIEDLSTLSQGSGLSEETPFTNIPQITELMEGFAFMYKVYNFGYFLLFNSFVTLNANIILVKSLDLITNLKIYFCRHHQSFMEMQVI